MNVFRQEMNGFLAAVLFLTRVPAGKWIKYQPVTFSNSLAYFPIVGAGVGAVGALTIAITHFWLPPALVILCCLLITILMTGGIHEDGIADTADGLFGGNTPERRLEIMRDSRLGSYGAMALWFLLAFKAVLLFQLIENQLNITLIALVIGHTLGRCSCMLLLYSCRYVGADDSKSRSVVQQISVVRILLGVSLPIIGMLWLWFHLAWICLLVLIGGTLFLKIFFEKKIGGVTGDCLGAASQLVEVGCYAAIGFLFANKTV